MSEETGRGRGVSNVCSMRMELCDVSIQKDPKWEEEGDVPYYTTILAF